MTETTSPTHIGPKHLRPPVDPTSGAMAIGVPIRHRGDDRRRRRAPVPVGEVGECGCAGRRSWPALEQARADAEALSDGLDALGDVGFMDAAGWFYLVDRKKDMISARASRSGPREVEDVLVAHPAVRASAVVGEPDEYRGETVKAFVSFKPGTSATLEEITAHCANAWPATRCRAGSR